MSIFCIIHELVEQTGWQFSEGWNVREIRELGG